MPRYLASLLLTIGLGCCTVSGAHAQDRMDRVDGLLKNYHEARLFNGVALVAEGEAFVYKKGFGEADMGWHIPNAPDTRFRIGSISKQFTAALILQLAEEGLINLHAPITTYVPAYPLPRGAQITIHHLLTHTSGIPDFTELPDFDVFSRRSYVPDSFLSVFAELPLRFEPGSRFEYSNSGYYLLGVIIERVTHQPYDEVLRTRLLEPLRLHDTGYDHDTGITERMAVGYRNVAGRYEKAPFIDPSVMYAAGMMYATAEDLARWTRLLHQGAPFQAAETLARMTTPFLDGYAYGLTVLDVEVGSDSLRVIAHTGGLYGFTAYVGYVPRDDRTLVVLDNTSAPAGTVGMAVLQALYGQPVQDPRRPVADTLAADIEQAGIEAAVRRFHVIRRTEADAWDFSEAPLLALAYAYLHERDTRTAIQLFELIADLYPRSWSAHEGLGEAYLKFGDRDAATARYRIAFDLNPESMGAKLALETLEVSTPSDTLVVPGAILHRFEGTYDLGDEGRIHIHREDDQLFFMVSEGSMARLYPTSETTFHLWLSDIDLTFYVDAAGHVASLTINNDRGPTQTGRKIK